MAKLKAKIYRSTDLWMAGSELKRLRKAAGFSRQQLAAKMNGWGWYEKGIKRLEKKAKVYLDQLEMQALLTELGASSI